MSDKVSTEAEATEVKAAEKREEDEKEHQFSIHRSSPIQRWQSGSDHGRQTDQESSHYFMSEPSLSDGEHSLMIHRFSPQIRDNHNTSGIPAVSRAALRSSPLTAGNSSAPPLSPGNTSLSSWESPHGRRRIHLHFSPEEKRVAALKIDPSFLAARPQILIDSHISSGQDSTPPTPRNHKKTLSQPKNKKANQRQTGLLIPYVNSSGESASASEGKAALGIDDFLSHLRKQSTGRLQDSAGAQMSFDTSVEDSDQNGVDAVIRSGEPAGHHRISSMDTALVKNTTSKTALERVAAEAQADGSSSNTIDDSIVMTLSASEDELSKGNLTDSDHPLDWEQQNSADDEKTAERPRRVRVYASAGKQAPGHRRTRSGDAVAATLVTGGADWKGMEQDRIPLPPPLEHDDDEDTEGKRSAEQCSSSWTKEPAAHFSIGTADNSRERPGRRSRRDNSSQPRTPRMQDNSKVFTEHGMAMPSPHSSRSQESAGRLLCDETNASDYVEWGKRPRLTRNLSLEKSSIHSSTHGDYYDNMIEAGHASWPSQPQLSDREDHWGAYQEHPPTQFESGGFSFGSAGSFDSSRFSHYSQNIPGPTQFSHAALQGAEISPLWSMNQSASHRLAAEQDIDRAEESDSIGYSSSDEDRANIHQNNVQYIPSMSDLPFAEQLLESREFRGMHQNVMRTRFSPFIEYNKTATKPDRSKFKPQTSFIAEDSNKYPTYICPRCKTRQREFFTASNAPRQFQTASGYLALYFGIYVVSSLYIFGLEEGWPALDCIYFAVITLTTAGLGDLVPTTDGAKIICSVFIYFGVACIGLLLGSYIAAMLDDVSHRQAEEIRLSSCPNCARLKNITECSEKRRSSHNWTERDVTSPVKRAQHMFMSEKLKVPYTQQNATQRNSQPGGESSEGHKRRRTHNHESVPDFGGDSDGDSFANPRESASARPPHSPRNSGQPSPRTYLGSPMTKRILKRQTHVRHTSLDQFKSLPARKYSADLPSVPTIKEGDTYDQNFQAPTAEYQMKDKARDIFDDVDDSSTESSESSDPDETKDIASRATKVQTAKYVFLTLKEALVNSLVIIAIGSLGFAFIEGFSFVDSWYFTTVLLTTVGYGDIVPVTKAGKLFATIYILVAGTMLLNNMSMISMIPLELRRRRIELAVLTQFGDQLDDDALRELATGPLVQRLHLSSMNRPQGLEECTREMFALAMLVRLGKVKEEDIRETFAAFRRLDVNNDGVLNSRSIIAGMIQRRRSSVNLEAMGRTAGQPQRQPPPPPFFNGYQRPAPNNNQFQFGNFPPTQAATIPNAHNYDLEKGGPTERSSLYPDQRTYSGLP